LTVQINASFVRKLTSAGPPAKRTQYRDSLLKGFLAVHHVSGRIAYYAQFARNRRKKLGEHPQLTANEAREAAKAILAAAQLGQLPAKEIEKEKVKLGDFAEGPYAEWARSHIKDYVPQMDRLRLRWGYMFNRQLDEITRAEVELHRTKRLAAGINPSTINREVIILRGVLSRAVEWGILEHHPLVGMKRLKVDQNRQPRMLSDEERTRFLAAVKSRTNHIRPLLMLLYYTGCRRGEAFNLVWADIDFDRRQVMIQGGGTKTGQSRIIPMTDALAEELMLWHRRSLNDCDLVFPNPVAEMLKSVKSGWKTILRDAGITDFRLHDLRADACSRLVNGKVPLAVAQRLLGHSSPETTAKHYARISNSSLREATEVL